MSEQRLIDANALLEVLEQRKRLCTGVYGDLGGAISGVIKLIDDAPTVEQFDDTELQRAIGYADGYSKGREERLQGKWVCIVKGNLGINMYACSLCGHRITCTEGAMKQHKGCYCGAQMKGDAK